MITNKIYKKNRTFRKHGFQRENTLKISDEKKDKNKFLNPSKKTPWNTRPLKTTEHSGKHCASYQFISVGPKRSLEANSSKKGYLPGYKIFWPTFYRIIESNKPQGTIYKGPQAILTITVELIRAFF